MKCLTKYEANIILRSVGMQIGDWNEVMEIPNRSHKKPTWLNYRAPKAELLNFSHHIARWLPDGKWKIFQIDNSTGWMDPIQASLFGGLLFGANNHETLDANVRLNRTFLFEFDGTVHAKEYAELLIANLIYLFLLFESHGYVVSSGSSSGEILGIQDGFAYFSSHDAKVSGADKLLESFERNPTTRPRWISEIIAARQELAKR